MPRLEDGQLLITANKFKKRRVWLTADDELFAPAPTKEDRFIKTKNASLRPNDQRELDNNKITIREQQDNNKITIREQLDNNKITAIPDENMGIGVIRQQQDNNKITIREQQDNKTASETKESADDVLDLLLRLSKQQRQLILFLHECCINTGNLSTGVILSHNLESHLGASNNTVRTQLFRLIERKLLVRQQGKRGRGGFHAFCMPLKVFKAAHELRRIFKDDFLENSVRKNDLDNNKITTRQQLDNTLDNKASLSSSSLIKTTTTSDTEVESLNLLEDIDISPLEEIGFKSSHLAQIKKRTDLTVEMIQSSINHFAFDLKENKKAGHLKGAPLNFFMGILAKGIPYSPPDNFEDEKIKAIKKFIETQNAQKLRLEELAAEAKAIAFENWYQALGSEERKKMLPDIFRQAKDFTKESWFKGHFDKEIWPRMQIIPHQEGVIS